MKNAKLKTHDNFDSFLEFDLGVLAAWRSFHQNLERSEIIVDAAEMKLSTRDLLEIRSAMGLTPDEAERMGIGT